ncbi:hypothetical protein EES39_09575 [Streptomyces sp. ADI92-24]|uniref:hypothetical protein n=1 Tax=Streptomyces sp. ADI92-24 TaxID=1522756 RepID=UPI000F554169|nr:hypothetical protein [Streptomyces sp. ADI92-24]RPK48393.1 hypothetical protein EES39_09575 [Streptomyces sp. ADI92-24]
MTTTVTESEDRGIPDVRRTRTVVLDAGRAAAVQQRRSDSERCRQRVLDVLAAMRKSRISLSDAEITRRAGVNPQYLQRHRDLKAETAAVRAHLAGDPPRAAAAASSRKEATLQLENRMLLEQNAALRLSLGEAQAELRAIRIEQLASRARDGLSNLPARDGDLDEMRRQRDTALASSRRSEADLVSLRNVNQRLMVDNSRLLQATSEHEA